MKIKLKNFKRMFDIVRQTGYNKYRDKEQQENNTVIVNAEKEKTQEFIDEVLKNIFVER